MPSHVHLVPGSRVDRRWTIERFVVDGGLGRVFEARDDDGGRAALKFYLPPPGTSHRTTQELNHVLALGLPGTVRFVAYAQHEQTTCLVTQWVEGRHFGEVNRPWRPEEVVVILLRLLRTLRQLSDLMDLVHGDVKPSNVLVRPSLHPVLIDFDTAFSRSVARVAEAHTPLWAPPELLLGDPATGATDLYAAALCAWLALTGRHAHGDNMEKVHKARLSGQLPRAPEGLRGTPVVALLHAMLAVEPERRPSMDEAIGQLESMTPPRSMLVAAGLQGDAPRLSAEQLTSLFAGPRCLLDLPLRAATLLEERAGGLPRGVEAHIQTWVELGLARLGVDHRLQVTLDDLEELETLIDPTPCRVIAGGLSDEASDVLAALGVIGAPTAAEQVVSLLGRSREQVESCLEELVQRGAVCGGPMTGYVALGRPIDTRELRGKRLGWHATLAEQDSGDVPRNLRHQLVLSRGGLVDGALAEARWLLAAGRPDRALRVLEQAAESVRRGQGSGGDAIAQLALEAAVEQPRAGAFVVAYRLAQRCSSPTMMAIGAATLNPNALERQRVLKDLEPQLAPSLRLLVRRIRAASTRELSPSQRRLEIEELDHATAADTTADALRHEWRGWSLYLDGKYEEAAAEFAAGAAVANHMTARAHILISEAQAWTETATPDKAREVALRLDEVARRVGYSWGLVRAAVAVRIAEYRMDVGGPADLDLVEATAATGWRYNEGQLAFTEATFAWRYGQLGLACELAERAVACLAARAPAVALLARALAAWITGDVQVRARVVDDARARKLPVGVLVQILALGGATRGELEAVLRGTELDWQRRREIVSIDEALRLADGTLVM